MRKSNIINAAKEYVKLFSNNSKPSRTIKSEYIDFVKLHLDSSSSLIHNLENDIRINYNEHSESVLRFLKYNNSRINHNGSNFLSSYDNKHLVALIIPVFTALIGLGYYFGNLESKLKLKNIDNKLDKLIAKPVDSSNSTYHKNNIMKENIKSDTL